MLKKIGQRALVGFAATALVHIILTLIMSQFGAVPLTEPFRRHFLNESAAICAQLALTSLIGIAFACGSIVFEMERWSFLLQGLVHFAVTSVVWVPISLVCWRPNSAKTTLYAALGWLFTYAVTWLVQYLIYRSGIRRLNERIESFAEEAEADE